MNNKPFVDTVYLYDQPLSLEAVEKHAQCPDCIARVVVIELPDNAYEAIVHHHLTCPFFRGITRGNK